MNGPVALDVTVTVGHEPGLKLGTLVVPKDGEVTQEALQRALAKFLRVAADRIDVPEGCDHPRLVPRMPCPECDPRDPLKEPFG